MIVQKKKFFMLNIYQLLKIINKMGNSTVKRKHPTRSRVAPNDIEKQDNEKPKVQKQRKKYCCADKETDKYCSYFFLFIAFVIYVVFLIFSAIRYSNQEVPFYFTFTYFNFTLNATNPAVPFVFSPTFSLHLVNIVYLCVSIFVLFLLTIIIVKEYSTKTKSKWDMFLIHFEFFCVSLRNGAGFVTAVLISGQPEFVNPVGIFILIFFSWALIRGVFYNPEHFKKEQSQPYIWVMYIGLIFTCAYISFTLLNSAILSGKNSSTIAMAIVSTVILCLEFIIIPTMTIINYNYRSVFEGCNSCLPSVVKKEKQEKKTQKIVIKNDEFIMVFFEVLNSLLALLIGISILSYN